MKIVAIGGGNSSNIKKTGEFTIYEHDNINKEIIKLSNKEKPNVLYVTHAKSFEDEEGSLMAFKNVFEKMYSCPVKLLGIKDLIDQERIDELLNWADVIYVGGGNTKSLLELWHKSGIDNKLKDLSNEKVLCGTSAGGGCWFKYICSDYLQMETGNTNAPFMPVKGLGLVDLVFNPHAGDHGRMRGIETIAGLEKLKGLSLTDNMAIEIVDDEYKLVRGISSDRLSIEAIISYWKDGQYIIEPVDDNGMITDLLKEKGKTYHKKK